MVIIFAFQQLQLYILLLLKSKAILHTQNRYFHSSAKRRYAVSYLPTHKFTTNNYQCKHISQRQQQKTVVANSFNDASINWSSNCARPEHLHTEAHTQENCVEFVYLHYYYIGFANLPYGRVGRHRCCLASLLGTRRVVMVLWYMCNASIAGRLLIVYCRPDC